MDPNGKDSLVEASPEWARLSSSTSRHRSTERRRVRRRTRKPNNIRSQIRVRIWIACTGVLLIMAVALYLVLERQPSGESSRLPGAPSLAAATA